MFWTSRKSFTQCLVQCLLFSSWLIEYVSVSADLRLSDSCAVQVNGGIINLKPLAGRNGPSLTTSFGKPGAIWNYSFDPCIPFSMPENPNDGFGDKCLSVAICKYAEQNRRMYYFTLGFHGQEEVEVYTDKKNKGQVALEYGAYLSLKGKDSRVKLVCDKKRTRPEDAIFRVVRDLKGLGNMEAELYHICCCPGGCPVLPRETVLPGDNVLPTSSSALSSSSSLPGKLNISLSRNMRQHNNESQGNYTEVSMTEASEIGSTADRYKVMIIVGVNIGILILAGLIGMMCYNKRTYQEIYHKVPGIRQTSEPTVWNLASLRDVSKGTKTVNHPMNSVVQADTSETRMLSPSSSKAQFRDYEKKETRRKSLCFPVLDNCMIPEDSLELGQRLGGSIFGDTYIGEWTGLPVAIKRITLSVHENQLNLDNMKWLQDEVSFLSRQRHRNIVSVLGFCAESKHPYIISEFIQGQCMKDYIKHSGSHLLWPHRVKILSQVADGMAYLHSTNPPILHRDLRCGNLFVTDNDVIKICDFGVVKLTQPLRSACQKDDCCCQGRFSACPPSIAWTAPEVLQNPNSLESDESITSKACDVYSFSIVMWELVMCDDPFEEMSTLQEVMDFVVSGGRPEIPQYDKMMPLYGELMEHCWKNKPEDRPNFKQVTVHLKELMHHAKAFQKALSSHSNGKIPVTSMKFSSITNSNSTSTES